MATLPKKMTEVFKKYENLDPESWKLYDFEKDIIAISRPPANYQNAKSAILRAQKAGLFPRTTEAYIKKHDQLSPYKP